MSLPENMQVMERRLKTLEERFRQSGYIMKNVVQSEVRENFPAQPQQETLYGMYTALVVDTIDPWKQNRVRFFTPLLHSKELPVKSLPWAYPISGMGGFDDCGLNWVPPAGSTVCIIFENGSRTAPYYIGTTWHRDRGEQGNRNFNYNIEEFYKIHEGNRTGYLLGKKDGSQVLPQWNTESANGIDIDADGDYEPDPEAVKKLTYAHIYGLKTPQKHMLKLDDGDYKCAFKNKRLELMSACGNWLIFKDDHLHEFKPTQAPGPCPSGSDNPDEENTECTHTTSGAYFKHENELRPWRGVGTPQNTKATLPQSGIQLLSISGHTLVMDDSVEQPTGKPDWERSKKSFDFGCTDKAKCKTFWVSATGHRIEMNDEETETEIRSEKNGIKMLTACGNRVELNDHCLSKETAGNKRGITLESTSRHIIEMVDDENEQGSARKEGGVPVAKSKKAFIRIRTGYGLEIEMKDDASQEKTQNQTIKIMCPQKDNKEKGPHLMWFKEKASGPGQVFLRVGGDYICSTADSHITMVGDPDKNPANKITVVSKNTVIDTKEFYFNGADLHVLLAKRIILLMAGQDCPQPNGGLGPCVHPVLVFGPKGITISDRVYASASKNAACASIFHLTPFHKCEA
jgi:hypothetical protein